MAETADEILCRSIALNYEIISRVKAKPYLWSISHAFYGNRGKCRIFWRELSRDLGMDETKLKKRWKHMKDQYRKEKKKIKEKGVGEPVMWQYFDSLTFLNEELAMRERERSGGAVGGDNTWSDNDSSESDGVERPNKVKVIEKSDDALKILRSMSRRLTETKSVVEERMKAFEEDVRLGPDNMYLMSLLPSMKQLSEIQKLQLKGKINDWLLEAITTNEYINECDSKFLVTEVSVDIQK